MAQQVQERRIDQFFSGPGARADEWRADWSRRQKHGRVDREIVRASKKNFLNWRSPKNIMLIQVRA